MSTTRSPQKLGSEAYATHPKLLSLSGYLTKEYVAPADTALSLPAYGYLNFQSRGSAYTALMDYNREKEVPYREYEPVAHIAIPSYTYDLFSMSGEGTGGMFRSLSRGYRLYRRSPDQQQDPERCAQRRLWRGCYRPQRCRPKWQRYSTTTSGPWLSGKPTA